MCKGRHSQNVSLIHQAVLEELSWLDLVTSFYFINVTYWSVTHPHEKNLSDAQLDTLKNIPCKFQFNLYSCLGGVVRTRFFWKRVADWRTGWRTDRGCCRVVTLKNLAFLGIFGRYNFKWKEKKSDSRVIQKLSYV